jgi:hypothetical protein
MRGMGVHSKEKKRVGGGLQLHLFGLSLSSHHLVINLVERQHKKRRLTKMEGNKTNESERNNDIIWLSTFLKEDIERKG